MFGFADGSPGLLLMLIGWPKVVPPSGLVSKNTSLTIEEPSTVKLCPYTTYTVFPITAISGRLDSGLLLRATAGLLNVAPLSVLLRHQETKIWHWD
jgi:hypothetical protein